MSTLLGLFLTLNLVGTSFAEWVYVTKNGKKYHHAESRFVKGKENIEKLTIEEAEKRGLEPSKDYLRFMAASEESEEVSDSKK